MLSNRISAVAVTALSVAVTVGSWRGAHAAARDLHPFLELHAPRAGAPIPIDAELDGKKVWESESGATGVFKDDSGRGMVPYTQAKVRWTPGTLYLLLYAGDLDLEGTVADRDGPVSQDDSFHLELGSDGDVHTIDVSVLGTLADAACAGTVGKAIRCDPRWDSRAVVAVDRDGSLNRLGDNDEEWVVEMAIPFSSLGMGERKAGDRIPFAIHRCDVSKAGRGTCGGFGTGKVRGEIVLEGT
jgi:hypothetical protein